MESKIVIEYKGNYLHVRHYGPVDYEISLARWRKIAAACREHDCYNILGESFTTSSLATMDAYDHAKIFEEVGVTPNYRIAWVSHTPEGTPGIKFIETVLKNRGMVNGYLFPSVEQATAWLLGEGETGKP